MKAAILKERGRIELEEVPRPQISEDTMLVKVRACGICGSDLRLYKKDDSRLSYPIIIGHEITGVVEELGKNITGFEIGDRVAVAPGHGCLKCVYCQKGQENLCINPHPSVGYAYPGGYAEYFVPPAHLIKAGFVNKIPNELSFEEASLSEPLACCLNAHRNMKLNKGDSVLILGAGPIGCIHAALSKLNGASQVFIADLDPKRLEFAKRFSPDRLINSLEENLKEIILKETNDLGVAAVFVCAPSKEAQIKGLELLAPKGKINFFGGLPKGDTKIELDANQVHYKELMITGTTSSTVQDNRDALVLLTEKKIKAGDFITHIYSLDQVKEALAEVENKAALKAVIRP